MDIYPVDYATPVGQLRLLIGDTEKRVDPADVAAEPSYLFGDGQLQAYLAINRDKLKFAAADAIDAIADNEILVSKKIRTEDLQTDGPAVGNALRLHATSLRAQQKLDDADDDDLDSFMVVPFEDRPVKWLWH